MEDLHTFDERMTKKGGYKHWLCTWNSPPKDWQLVIGKMAPQFIAGQLETAPTTGQIHAQFYLYFPENVAFSTLKRFNSKISWFGKTPHAALDCYNYVSKLDTSIPDTYVELGKKPPMKPNVKSAMKYEITLKNCKDGKWEDSDPEHQVKYLPNLTKLTAHYAPSTDAPALRGVWLRGSPGSGKSYVSRHQFGLNFYLKAQSKWWDNYRQEPTVILEDLDHGGACLGHYLKIWLDRYAFKGEIKGGTVSINCSRFIITSNYEPEDLWPTDLVLCEAIRRRVRLGKTIGIYPDFKIVWDDENEYFKSLRE